MSTIYKGILCIFAAYLVHIHIYIKVLKTLYLQIKAIQDHGLETINFNINSTI